MHLQREKTYHENGKIASLPWCISNAINNYIFNVAGWMELRYVKFSFSNLNRVCINFHLSSSASLGVPNGGEGNLLCHGSRHKDVLHRLSGRYRQIAIKDTMSWYMNKKGDIDV
ncbi:hypothetical protein NQ317_000734 [Molorchus minor]|uniref:Uncharacterized protein n=1 Tax=Molorchus minor TaxID=1323400 RepID=A0ABQ9IS43_9CUCU|nr:hypothetical protein NQ317_000734 [Molorchus minor]